MVLAHNENSAMFIWKGLASGWNWWKSAKNTLNMAETREGSKMAAFQEHLQGLFLERSY